jgi:hypothetical protein
MKSLLILLTIISVSSGYSQEVITIEGDIAWVFKCDTLVKASQGIALMNEKCFRKSSITVGKNRMTFNFREKTMVNVSGPSDKLLTEVRTMENIIVRGDTLSFYTDAISAGEEKIPYRIYWTLMMNPNSESDIVWFSALMNPDNKEVLGQFVKKSMCVLTVER